MKARPLLFGRLILPAVIVAISSFAHAAAISWDDQAADDLWSTATNWNPD